MYIIYELYINPFLSFFHSFIHSFIQSFNLSFFHSVILSFSLSLSRYILLKVYTCTTDIPIYIYTHTHIQNSNLERISFSKISFNFTSRDPLQVYGRKIPNLMFFPFPGACLIGNPCSYISPENRSAARRRDGQCFKRVKI